MPPKLIRSWTEPRISPKNINPSNVGHHCYVWFRYYDQEKGKWSHPIKRKPALEYPYNKKDHYQELKALVKAIDYKLRVQAWDPITNTTRHIDFDVPGFDQERVKWFDFSEAIDFAFEKKKPDWSERSVQCYKSAIKVLKSSAKKVNLSELRMKDFELPHFKLLLEHVKSDRKLSAAGFNKYRSYLSGLVGEMIQWQIVKFNLVFYVKTKKEDRNLAHRPPTRDERNIIITRIKNDHPNYYRFLSVLYGCTMRPVEITRLQIKHLHIKEGVFRLPAANMKTKEYREVVIPDWVLAQLMELNLHKYDREYYIFSTNNKYSSFLPGPRMIHVHSTQRYWKKIVKDDLKLDINQYSLKKLAGDDMIRLQVQSGLNNLLELPRIQMGHANQSMTSVYVNEHLNVQKELIKTKMPVL
jgi:integrase